ncbi:hypothetical protein BH09PSE1_BH09PSE1_19720 [soil metagenome]
MRLFFVVPATLGVLLLGSACGSTAAPGATSLASTGPDQCFSPDHVTNFASSRNSTLYLRAIDRKVFELETTGACFDLNSTSQLVVRSFRGGSRLCVGDNAEVAIAGAGPGGGNVQTCHARVIRSLTEDQVAALPSRARP